MIAFEDGVWIVLCGDNRQAWADKFDLFWGNSTHIVGTGTWVNESKGCIDNEPTIILMHDCEFTDSFCREFIRLASEYQASESQEAVYIKIIDNGRMKTRIVFNSDDWAMIEKEINRTSVLLDFFSRGEA